MAENTDAPDPWLKLIANEERLGLKGLDYETYLARRSQLPEQDQRVLQESFEAVARDFAMEHFRVFKRTVLSWTHDPRIVRLLADPRLKELPQGQLAAPLFHACNHLGEEVRARSAARETIPHAILLGIGVVMGWYARTVASRIGERDYIAKGGRVGAVPKLDPATQTQVYLWKRDGIPLNEILRRLSARGISITKAGIKKAIKREETLHSSQGRNVN